MSQQIKTMHGFAVCLRATPKGNKYNINNWWTRIYRYNELYEILELSKNAGSKPIAAIKIYLK